MNPRLPSFVPAPTPCLSPERVLCCTLGTGSLAQGVQSKTAKALPVSMLEVTGPRNIPRLLGHSGPFPRGVLPEILGQNPRGSYTER